MPEVQGREIFIDETSEDRANIIESIAELDSAEKQEHAELYAQTLAEHIHTDPSYSFLTLSETANVDLDTTTGLVKSKSPEALTIHMLDGYHRDRVIESILLKEDLTQDDVLEIYAVIRAKDLDAIEAIVQNPVGETAITAKQEASDFIKTYSGGLKTSAKYTLGTGGAYGKQLQPRAQATERYDTTLFPNSYLSRLMMHALNYGGIRQDGTINSNEPLPDFEAHIGDQPYDPIIPIEYAPDEFFQALKVFSKTFKAQTYYDAEIIDAMEDKQHEIVFTNGPIRYHESLAGHEAVSAARLRLLAKHQIESPVVIHVDEKPTDENAGLERLIGIAKTAVENNVPIVIENNRYQNGNGEMVYHTGSEYAQIVRAVVKQVYAELKDALPEDTLRTRIENNIGVTIDFAHLHCAPPHLGSSLEMLQGSSGVMLTATEKKAQTLDSVQKILDMLDTLAEEPDGMRLRDVNLHVAQNRDRGKDTHDATLVGVGTVPNKEAFNLVTRWGKDKGVTIRSTLELGGNIHPDEVEAIVENKDTAIEKAARIVSVNILAENPEVLAGGVEKIKDCGILALDIPEYTLANSMSEEMALSMHALVLELRRELAGMVDSGPYGEAFIANAVGDEILIGLKSTQDKKQNELRSFLLALDAQIIFWKLLEKEEYSKLKALYNEDVVLHCGIATGKNFFVQAPTVNDKMYFMQGGSSMSIKRVLKTQGLARILAEYRPDMDVTDMARRFYDISQIQAEQLPVATILGSEDALDTQRKRMIAWRNSIATQISVAPLRSLAIDELMQSKGYENAKPAIENSVTLNSGLEGEIVKSGTIVFGRMTGLERTYEQLSDIIKDAETLDLFRFITTNEIGKALLEELEQRGWEPREVECDYNEGDLGMGNFTATRGIFSAGGGQNTSVSELGEVIETIKQADKFDVIKKNIQYQLTLYLQKQGKANLQQVNELVESALSYVTANKLQAILAFEELGENRYAIAENLQTRSPAHPGPRQISGNAMPLAARLAFNMLKETAGDQSMVVSTKENAFMDPQNTQLYLKGIGNTQVHYARVKT